MKMLRMEYLCGDTDRGGAKYSNENVSLLYAHVMYQWLAQNLIETEDKRQQTRPRAVVH
jgi:hypothetical protein